MVSSAKHVDYGVIVARRPQRGAPYGTSALDTKFLSTGETFALSQDDL
jgi:hypothetical protein